MSESETLHYPAPVNSEALRTYWKAFVASQANMDVPEQPYEADTFGDSRELADELGTLVVAGTKTASCSALWEWEAEGRKPPRIGQRTIVLDGGGRPLCIIETTSVEILAFREVDEELAFDEGEGDRSLKYWRSVHWDYFSRTLSRIGRAPSEEMPLVCERFTVIF